jgi:hypothetical protein
VTSLRSPDEVLFAYLEARERAHAPRSPRLVRDEGLSFAPSCRNRCEAASRTYRVDPELDIGAWVCDRCAAPWPVSFGVLLAGDVQESKRRGPEHLLERVAEMGLALSKLDPWERRIYLELYLWRGLTLQQTAAAANDRWARKSRVWSVWRVRQVVAKARDKLRSELRIRPRSARPPR